MAKIFHLDHISFLFKTSEHLGLGKHIKCQEYDKQQHVDLFEL